MATVFLGHREGAGDPWGYFAVKCVRPNLADDPTFIAMFRDEARIASWIHHANVCSVFDFGVSEGTHYLAMEYLSGQTLKSVLRKLAEPTAITDLHWHACLVARIGSDVAEGLHAAHELRDDDGQSLGVVHRDVSPENVFLTYGGNAKLMDFGLVRALGQSHETRTGIVKGKYGYVQPEVLQGDTPDRRADVWSLGVVMWELLVGRRLFAFDTEAATLKSIADKEITPPSRAREGLPRAIDAIVMRALERDPDARYPTARAMARDLTRFIARSGQAVGLADIADMMDRLYPGGAECDRQLLSVAHQIEEASVAWELAAAEPRGREPAVPQVPANSTPTDPFPLPRSPRGRLVAALAGGLALGGAMTWSLGDRNPTSPDAAAHVVSASIQPTLAPDAQSEPLRRVVPPLPPPPGPRATIEPPPPTEPGRRVELVGQDDLASGEMLLRVRVVDERQSARHRRW